MLNFSNLLELLIKFNSFIITTHVNPDPDAIGSEIAISEILKQLNKNFKIINRSETPYNIKFWIMIILLKSLILKNTNKF